MLIGLGLVRVSCVEMIWEAMKYASMLARPLLFDRVIGCVVSLVLVDWVFCNL